MNHVTFLRSSVLFSFAVFLLTAFYPVSSFFTIFVRLRLNTPQRIGAIAASARQRFVEAKQNCSPD
jgi:hypothetical protein